MSIAVVGGGITGLTTAYFLTEQKEKVTLYEANEKLGGLAKSFKDKNWDWALEEYFHHYFVTDSYVKNLAEELKISDKLFYKKAQTSVFSQGNIYPFDQAGEFLKYPHLNYFNKLRMGIIIFFLRSFPYLPLYDKFSASKLFPKLVGEKGWQLIWKPLMEGKFHNSIDQVSFSWLWARIKKRSARLGYFKGGTKILIDKLADEIKKNNQIATNYKIDKIKKDEHKWILVSGKKEVSADKIVLAVPLPQALKLIQNWKELDNNQVAEWRKLKNIGALTLVLRLEKKLLPGSSYWLNILEEEFPFLVVVEQTNFIDPSHYGNENVAYVGGYYPSNASIFNQDKEKILSKFSPYLRRLNPSFENYLIDYQVNKYLNAQPVVPTNYSSIKPGLSLITDQIYWATPNHIFPWDRGLNYSIKLGKEAARVVLNNS